MEPGRAGRLLLLGVSLTSALCGALRQSTSITTLSASLIGIAVSIYARNCKTDYVCKLKCQYVTGELSLKFST